MALGGGMSCVKYLLFCFNLLFAVTGLIIMIVGAKTLSSAYVSITDEHYYTSGPIVLITIGVIVFIVAFFGCCGAVKENHCMIVTFSVLLLIIFVAELAVGIAGYMAEREVEAVVLKGLNETIKDYPTNPDVRKNFDLIQTDLKCCGMHGPSDWTNNSIPIPAACCASQEIVGGEVTPCTPLSPEFHKEGCLNKVVTLLKDLALVLGGVGIGIAFIQLLGVIFACCLARSIRNQYETV